MPETRMTIKDVVLSAVLKQTIKLTHLLHILYGRGSFPYL